MRCASSVILLKRALSGLGIILLIVLPSGAGTEEQKQETSADMPYATRYLAILATFNQNRWRLHLRAFSLDCT